jgi:KUP system potassium uptake protein
LSNLEGKFHRVLLHYGFLDPNVTVALMRCQLGAPEPSHMDTSYFLSGDNLIPSDHPDLQPWREQIFIQMANTALDPMFAPLS